VLLYEATGNAQYAEKIVEFCDWLKDEAPKTPGGMLYLADWGSARVTGYAALSLLLVSMTILKIFRVI
jgi:hypothetical protein